MLPIAPILLISYFFSAECVPINSDITIVRNNETYDASQFDEVYDQRQNGSENYRVNLNKVVLVWSPPGSLLTAALLADPALYDAELGELEDFLKPENMAPSTTSSETTPAASPPAESSKRKLRIPGFIRPFVRKHQPKQ